MLLVTEFFRTQKKLKDDLFLLANWFADLVKSSVFPAILKRFPFLVKILARPKKVTELAAPWTSLCKLAISSYQSFNKTSSVSLTRLQLAIFLRRDCLSESPEASVTVKVFDICPYLFLKVLGCLAVFSRVFFGLRSFREVALSH